MSASRSNDQGESDTRRRARAVCFLSAALHLCIQILISLRSIRALSNQLAKSIDASMGLTDQSEHDNSSDSTGGRRRESSATRDDGHEADTECPGAKSASPSRESTLGFNFHEDCFGDLNKGVRGKVIYVDVVVNDPFGGGVGTLEVKRFRAMVKNVEAHQVIIRESLLEMTVDCGARKNGMGRGQDQGHGRRLW